MSSKQVSELGEVFTKAGKNALDALWGGAQGDLSRISRRASARINLMSQGIEQHGLSYLKAPVLGGMRTGAMIGAVGGMGLEATNQVQSGHFDGGRLVSGALRGGIAGGLIGAPGGIAWGIFGPPRRLSSLKALSPKATHPKVAAPGAAAATRSGSNVVTAPGFTAADIRKFENEGLAARALERRQNQANRRQNRPSARSRRRDKRAVEDLMLGSAFAGTI